MQPILPWAQEVPGSNPGAPTNPFNNLQPCRIGIIADCDVVCDIATSKLPY
jgi:hypothetical protein